MAEPTLANTLTASAERLETLANKCDQMVAENNRGGWSTNNNESLTGMANDLRREAAGLRQLARADLRVLTHG